MDSLRRPSEGNCLSLCFYSPWTLQILLEDPDFLFLLTPLSQLLIPRDTLYLGTCRPQPENQVRDLHSHFCPQFVIIQYHAQHCIRPTPSGGCPPSLTPFLGDFTKTHGRPMFSSFSSVQ